MKTLVCILLLLAVCFPARGEISLSVPGDGIASGSLEIRGTSPRPVYVRVTGAATGPAGVKKVTPDGEGRFVFKRAVAPDVYFVDVSAGPAFAPEDTAERCVIVRGDKSFPELPSAFTCDLLDRRGRRDRDCREYGAVRCLVNLYMNSRGALLSGRWDRRGFDLDRDEDMAYFKEELALYDFAHRDRDWSKPLGGRPARCFWQSVWPRWFNSTNDHPLDGDPGNGDPSNYMPYAFSNDFSDILIMYLMRLPRFDRPFDDNLREMCRQAVDNLMAMQNLSGENFALTDRRGVRELYTKGAFRYGMFVNGDYLTEGKGWFYNPAFLDYAGGGVLNGRCLWALCESALADPGNPRIGRVKQAISLGLQFCLSEGREGGYTKTTPQGNAYWRDAGEHAYLALGLARIAGVMGGEKAYQKEGRELTVREACIESLDALADLQKEGRWSVYPNVDSMAIAALSEGCLSLGGEKQAPRWREAARRGADYWTGLYVRPGEFRGEAVHFGLSLVPGEMTYRWGRADGVWKGGGQFFFYQSGHWLHALARLYKVTGEPRYLQRCRRITAYLLGDNPLKIRVLTETGGVYNWFEDTDGDGVEDAAFNNMYPESTAFCQIGLMHFFDALGK
ncbi:MAG: hypothetical protein IJT95_07240 [Abditibacteriota bacterium]|nr:hypothetical protein [Abditibacteriota bacterium]